MLTFSRERYDLSGTWRMAPDPFDAFEERAPWAIEAGRDEPSDVVPAEWATVAVPSSWNAARAELAYYEGAAWYERQFRFQKHHGRRYFLEFEAVNYAARVWLNGVLVGEHEGGFTPFWLDVTEQLIGSNTLLVKVDNRRRADGVPALVYDWFNFGGITRPVSIVSVPDGYVRNVKVSTRLDGARTLVRFEVLTEGALDGPAKVRIPEANFEETVPCTRRGRCEAEFEIYPELWSPESPRLYTVRVSCGHDSVSETVGFRELRVEGPDILLNAKPIRLYGVCMHEEADGKGRTLDETAAQSRLRSVHDLHGNFARLAHYPHTELMARAADKLGVLLWEEIPVYWAIDFQNKATLALAKAQLEALIERDWNRASVAFWSIGNETEPSKRGRTAFMAALAELARKLDGSRPVTAACTLSTARSGAISLDDPLAAKLDVVGVNEYFGWYGGDVDDLLRWEPPAKGARPIVISEVGAGAAAGHHGSPATRWTEEFQAAFYRRQLEAIGRLAQVGGVAPWVLFDFRSPLRTNRWQKGYNRKGLLDEAGRRKQAFAVLAAHYAEAQGIQRPARPAAARGVGPRRRRGGRREAKKTSGRGSGPQPARLQGGGSHPGEAHPQTGAPRRGSRRRGRRKGRGQGPSHPGDRPK